jgi:hypothetical protein
MAKSLFERRRAMWLSSNHRVTILSIIVITGIAAALLATTKSSPDSIATSKQSGGFGTSQEAFDAASSVVRHYICAREEGRVVIDPEFRSTLLSRSKIWTIKGYASCPDNDNVYRWTVIMNYHDMQEWEILDKTITLISEH